MSERIGVQATRSYENRSSENISVPKITEAERLAREAWPRFHKTWEAMVEAGEMPREGFLKVKKLAGVE